MEVPIEKHGTGASVIETTPWYWECKCEGDHTHRSEHHLWGTDYMCPKCGTKEGGMPDARIEDVLKERPFEVELWRYVDCECGYQEGLPADQHRKDFVATYDYERDVHTCPDCGKDVKAVVVPELTEN